VDVGEGEGEAIATFLSLPDFPPCWMGSVQPTTDRKTAATAANHLPLPESLRTEREAKCISLRTNFS